MTRALFVDTAGWTACVDESDPANDAACRARDGALEAGRRLVTTDYVIDETLTLLRMRFGVAVAEAWWNQVRGSSRLALESIDTGRADKARLLFFRYRDKDLSFTDCTSFVVMQELRIKDALTTDSHFQQVGFNMLPDPSRRRR
jgi:predicted nucleic acid-binding protein